MPPMMTYKEYLEKNKSNDTQQNWIYWKIEICGMEYNEAVKAAYNPV